MYFLGSTRSDVKGEDPVIWRCAWGEDFPEFLRIHQVQHSFRTLMNNAMEAVEYLPKVREWIQADIRVKADYLVIAVENPFARRSISEWKKAAGADMAVGSFQEIRKRCMSGNCNVKIDSEKRYKNYGVILDVVGTSAEEREKQHEHGFWFCILILRTWPAIPTTFFLMHRTLKWRGTITKVLDPADHLQYSFMQRERIYEFR